jgi:hypothetical protein
MNPIVASLRELAHADCPGDATDWASVLPEAPEEPTYLSRRMGRGPAEEMEKLRRAAGGLALLVTRYDHVTGALASPQPLRWGKLATTGADTYRRMLHASAAGLFHAEAIAHAQRGDVPAASSSAGKASRHLTAAGEWVHDAALRPSVFGPEFKHKNDLLVNALWLAGRDSAVTATAASRSATIGIAQATLAMPGIDCAPKLRSAVTTTLNDHVFIGWPRDLRDPRPITVSKASVTGPMGDAVDESEREIQALAAMSIVAAHSSFDPRTNPAPSDIGKFYEVNLPVYTAAVTKAAALAVENGGVTGPRDPGVLAKYVAVKQMKAAAAELPTAPPEVLGYSA